MKYLDDPVASGGAVMQRRADIDGVASKYSFPKGAHAEKSCILPLPPLSGI